MSEQNDESPPATTNKRQSTIKCEICSNLGGMRSQITANYDELYRHASIHAEQMQFSIGRRLNAAEFTEKCFPNFRQDGLLAATISERNPVQNGDILNSGENNEIAMSVDAVDGHLEADELAIHGYDEKADQSEADLIKEKDAQSDGVQAEEFGFKNETDDHSKTVEEKRIQQYPAEKQNVVNGKLLDDPANEITIKKKIDSGPMKLNPERIGRVPVLSTLRLLPNMTTTPMLLMGPTPGEDDKESSITNQPKHGGEFPDASDRISLVTNTVSEASQNEVRAKQYQAEKKIVYNSGNSTYYRNRQNNISRYCSSLRKKNGFISHAICKICSKNISVSQSGTRAMMDHAASRHLYLRTYACRICSKALPSINSVHVHFSTVHFVSSSGAYDDNTIRYEGEILAGLKECFARKPKVSKFIKPASQLESVQSVIMDHDYDDVYMDIDETQAL